MRIKLADVNRLVVLVEDSTIKLFLNSSLVAEYKDPSFTGGTVDFDNFELRRRPQ
jgi:hypothetical protein